MGRLGQERTDVEQSCSSAFFPTVALMDNGDTASECSASTADLVLESTVTAGLAECDGEPGWRPLLGEAINGDGLRFTWSDGVCDEAVASS